MAGLSDEEFVGYTFNGAPEQRPRLWFLDRHIRVLLGHGLARPTSAAIMLARAEVTNKGDGWWNAELPEVTGLNDEGLLALDGIVLRYQHNGAHPWAAVWRLTDVVIPHVHTFGRDDDVWRLGLWPD